MRRSVLPVLAAVALSACAEDRSYVGPVRDAGDARVLAGGVAEFVSLRVRTPHSTVTLEPVPSAQADNAVTPEVVAALRRQGFGVAADRSVAAGLRSLRYVVTSLDEGELIRMTLDDAVRGARFFARNASGYLQTGGPFTVTEAMR